MQMKHIPEQVMSYNVCYHGKVFKNSSLLISIGKQIEHVKENISSRYLGIAYHQ